MLGLAVYKVQLKPTTSFVGNITSNTLFGAFCFAIRDLYGEDTLLDIFENSEDSLVFSNLFPHNTIPNFDAYLDIDTNDVVSYAKNKIVTHNMQSRDNSLTYKWSESESWSKDTYDFYIKTSIFEMDDLESLLNIVLMCGIGRHRSKGKGQFKLVSIEQIEHIVSPVSNANGYLILSDYIPNPTDSTYGVYTARAYQGATSGIRKAPLFLINAGSRFAGSMPDNIGVVGRLHRDTITNTYISGLALAIPIVV